eukprot:COSAG05_NODE_416_length_10031_cov_18.951067_9_plen_178_part_00
MASAHSRPPPPSEFSVPPHQRAQSMHACFLVLLPLARCVIPVVFVALIVPVLSNSKRRSVSPLQQRQTTQRAAVSGSSQRYSHVVALPLPPQQLLTRRHRRESGDTQVAGATCDQTHAAPQQQQQQQQLADDEAHPSGNQLRNEDEDEDDDDADLQRFKSVISTGIFLFNFFFCLLK